MFNTIIKATENFCIHQIRESYLLTQNTIVNKGLVTFIEIDIGDDRYNIYISYDINFAKKITKIFLEEEDSDKETLIDMVLESTNLIVGSAKVIAQDENNLLFNIGTPNFTNTKIIKTTENQFQTFIIDDSSLTITYEKIDD